MLFSRAVFAFVLTGIAAFICVTRRRLPAPGAPAQTTRGWLLYAVLTAGYVLMLSIVGGVTLARYLLPIYPLVSLACIATISSRVKWWPAVAGLAAVALVAGLFPYTDRYLFWRDDNLAYLIEIESFTQNDLIVPGRIGPRTF